MKVTTQTGPYGSAFRTLAQELRDALREGRYGTNGRLPTEAALVTTHGLSRQTVRRAMQDLVSEGLIYRVPGRGTFPTTGNGHYLRQFGSVEDLMGLSLDTRMQLVCPLARGVDLAAAGRLRLDHDVVWSVSFRREHEGLPICFTRVSLPPDVGQLLSDVPELGEPGSTSAYTVLGLLDARLAQRVCEAEQSITVAEAPAPAAKQLGTPEATPVLRIDRVYLDPVRPVELAVSWFHPDHYSYRVRLRRSGG